MVTRKQPARSTLPPTARCRHIGWHRAAVPGSQRTATCSSRYRAAGSATGGPRGSIGPMGAGIGFSPASTRVAMVAARCRACSTRAPAPSTAGPTTLAPTVALALLFGEYMQRACHGRYDAKARNLRRSLRADAAFADAVEWRNPQARHVLIEVCPPPRSCTTSRCAIPPGADHCLSDGKGGSPVAASRCSYYVRSDD